jgi:hypothetical protein
MSACLLSLAGYTDKRGVRNLTSGHRTRKTGGIFFACRPVASACPINGREGREIPNTRRRSSAVLNLPTTLYRVIPIDLRNH